MPWVAVTHAWSTCICVLACEMGPRVETSKMAVKSVNGSFPSPDELPLTILQVIDWETKTGVIGCHGEESRYSCWHRCLVSSHCFGPKMFSEANQAISAHPLSKNYSSIEITHTVYQVTPCFVSRHTQASQYWITPITLLVILQSGTAETPMPNSLTQWITLLCW